VFARKAIIATGPGAILGAVTPTAIDFFAEAKVRSLYKLDVYGKYLRPLTNKLGRRVGPHRPGRHIWIVDGFAGSGSYEPDDGGRVQDGSPLIAAKFARHIAFDRGYPVVRCINVERDADCFAQLQRNLAPWQEVAISLHGSFAAHLDDILDTIRDDPALIFLDPFGVNGIEMDVLARILARAGKTELLVHFSDKTFLRMAGHLDDNDKRLPFGRKVGEAKLRRLDAVIGTPLWRRLWHNGAGVDTDKAIDATVELYLSQLRTRINYAHQIRMRDHYHARTAYRLVFCTNSPHGVELMSDIACCYETELEDAAAAGAMTLWAADEARQRITDLRDVVHATGLRRGGIATREQIIHELAPALFGRYRTSEYAQVLRELVRAGLIDRSSPTGIEQREPLHFIEPAQGSLLG
jgi:three-Cys-motif partner protein